MASSYSPPPAVEPVAFEIDITDAGGPPPEQGEGTMADEDAEEEEERTALERMLEVKELFDAGLLTKDEFESKRIEILDEL